MLVRTGLASALALLLVLSAALAARGSATRAVQDEDQRALGGVWLFVEDRTEGRPVEEGGPPMSVRFQLRVEEDALVHVRGGDRDERIPFDGSATERLGTNSITRFRGGWKDGAFEYEAESLSQPDNQRTLLIWRRFRHTAEGLFVHVALDGGSEQVALYRHPEDIALPAPAKATIEDMGWLAAVWVGENGKSSIEERWSPPAGGAMLGVSRTVNSSGRMSGFEYLRIVERDGGLVYVAQPGGRSPTEFVLTELFPEYAVFVNPRHDYPQRIVYELVDEETLNASIGFAKGRLQVSEYYREGE